MNTDRCKANSAAYVRPILPDAAGQLGGDGRGLPLLGAGGTRAGSAGPIVVSAAQRGREVCSRLSEGSVLVPGACWLWTSR